MASITWESLAKHRSIDNLWIAIDGKAYDVTQWSKVHPGGALVLLHYAGEDATQQFLANHPEDVKTRLLDFYQGPMEACSAKAPSKVSQIL